MKCLYILSEGERDDLFYDLLAEKASGLRFDRPGDFRLRHGSNWKTALSAARLLMQRVRCWTTEQDVYVILSVDNDRSPRHPASAPPDPRLSKHDRTKASRYEELKAIRDTGGTAVKIAMAVPVEMVESWVLLLLDPTRPELPRFAEAKKATARAFYGTTPPPQLKDLRQQEAKKRGMNDDELFLFAAEQEPAPAAAASPSLAMFLGELSAWRPVDESTPLTE